MAATCKEGTGLVQIPLVAHGSQMGDGLVGDRQRHLGGVEFVTGDELEQEVEWAFEVEVRSDRELPRRLGLRHDSAASRYKTSAAPASASMLASAEAIAARTMRPRSTA